MQRLALFSALPLFAVLSVACAPATDCVHLTDCPGALVCSIDGRCVESEAPIVFAGGGGVSLTPGRADPEDSLVAFVTGAGFAGSIGGAEFSTTSPAVSGTSSGYVAWQLTTEVPGGVAGMWFDIPLPELLPVGEPRVFTLEEMLADGSMPCISLWGVDGVAQWAEDYVITQYPEDEDGNVLLELDATTATDEATATLTVPALQ